MRLTKFQLLHKGRSPSQYVLFVRSGSEKPQVLKNLQESRNITVVVSLYETPSYEMNNEWWIVAGARSKLESAKLFLDAFPVFFSSSLIAFLDPDIIFQPQELSRLFIEGERLNCCLFQASLSPDSHASWRFLNRFKKGRGWRKVTFVEVMAPIFKTEFLKSVYTGFSHSTSTWGLEYEWYSHARGPLMVCDTVEMKHLSPVDMLHGKFYLYLSSIGIDPWKEKDRLRSINVKPYYRETTIPWFLPWSLTDTYLIVIFIVNQAADRCKQYFRSWLKGMKKQRHKT